jgi:hypothetical protein
MGKIIIFRYIMSEWIKHVKRFQAEKGCSYKDALKHASATYRKGSGLRNMSDTGMSGFVANERLTTSKPPQKIGGRLTSAKPYVYKMQQMAGMGKTGTMLKQNSADNVVKLLNSATTRAVRAMNGSGFFGDDGKGSRDTNFSKQGALDSANFVSSHQSGFKGLGINRINKANRWQTFVDTTLRDTIDTAGKAGRVYNDTTSPLSQLGFGLKRHKRLSGRALLAAGY